MVVVAKNYFRSPSPGHVLGIILEVSGRKLHDARLRTV